MATALATAGRAQADPSSTSPEQGYDLGEVQTARAVGMGGALDALGVSTTGLYLNPANLALARVYHLEAMGAFSPEARRESFGASIVDSVINKNHLAGGIGGVWSNLDPDGIHRQWTDVRAALALPLGDRLAMGVTGRYLRVDQAVAAGPFGPSSASDGTRDGPVVNQLTFDAGATATLGDSFRVGVVGHNLTNPGTALAPTTLSGGIGFFTQTLALEADALEDFTTWSKARTRVMVGGEIFVADHYAIRAGYRWDQGTQAHAPSLGFGYIERRWGIEIGGRRDLTGDRSATMIALSLRYFYDAVGASPADEPDSF